MKTIVKATSIKPTGADLFDKVKSSCGCKNEPQKKNCSCGCQIKKEVMKSIIKGTVVDDLNNPMLGANVVNLSNKKGVATNDNGYFELEAKPDDLIRISFVGFATINQTASKLTFPIKMIENKNMLDEVVIEAKKSIKNNVWLWVSGGLFAIYVYAKTKKVSTPTRVKI